MGNEEINKAIVRECFATASSGEYAFDAVLSPDYVLHPEEAQGVDGLRGVVEGYKAALPDLRVSIDHQFTEGEHVATRFTIRGTHDGDLMGAAPTGRRVEFSGLCISRCEDGRIAEEWELVDTVSLLAQVGALPAPAQA